MQQHSSRFIMIRNLWPWLMYVLAASFYCYEYLLRVSPSVMMPELSSYYNVSAAMLGNTVACYYYIYTLMQLPVGILMDRYGPRNLLTFACLCCSFGTYLFVCSGSIWVAQLGRLLVGFGSAFAFVGVLHLARLWLPKDRFAVISGVTLALGMFGALCGDVFLTELVGRMGWRHALYLSAVAGLVLSVLIFCIIRNRRKCHSPHSIGEFAHNTREDFSSLWAGMRNLVRNKYIWINSVVGCLMFVPVSAFAELWGIPFLEVVHGYTKSQSAHAISMVFVGIALGGPLVGWFADKVGSKRSILLVGAVLEAIIITLVIYDSNLNYVVLCGSLFMFGFVASSQVLVFAISCDHSPAESTATALALTNMVVMMNGVIFQPLIGWMLDWSSQGVIGEEGNLFAYTAYDYQHVMLVMPISVVVAIVCCIYLREDQHIIVDADTCPLAGDTVS